MSLSLVLTALLTISMTVAVLLASSDSNVYATTVNNSDIYLEAKVTGSPVKGAHSLEITNFEIQGNSSTYKEMCPSLQCEVDYKEKYTFFEAPEIPKQTLIISHLDFRLKDDVTHADLGPKKKDLAEQYTSIITCDVADIVEENGQELYKCHTVNLNSMIMNKLDQRSWAFKSAGIYDAKSDLFKLTGNFTK